MIRYSYATRREYIQRHLHLWKPHEKSGLSLRDIAWKVKENFGLETAPSPSTITSDLKIIAEGRADHSPSDEALDALAPENFPEWRKAMFVDPKGDPYETPIHQYAWFYLLVSLALKQPLPEWVVEWFTEHDVDLSEINDWAENLNQLVTIFLLAPPRHGKTDLLRHTVIWLICRQPNIRIMWQSHNLPTAEITTAWLKREFETNQKLIAEYGPFVQDGNWSDNHFIVATRTINLASPTIQAFGKTTGTINRDADVIVSDDIFDPKSSESITQVTKDVRLYKAQTMTRREPWTPILGIGSHSPSPTGDGYNEMERQSKDSTSQYSRFVMVKIKAHDYSKCKDGDTDEEKHGAWCLLWPSLRPFWFLEAAREDLGEVDFEVIYNQESRKAGIDYFPEKIVRGDYPTPFYDAETGRYADFNPITANMSPGILDRNRSWGMIPYCCERETLPLLSALGFDPASGETRHASESALCVAGACRICARRYLIDIWHARQSPEKNPYTIDQFAGHYHPMHVRIEINAYQKALARDPLLSSAQSAHKFIIDEWTTDERRDDPTLGIPILSRHMNIGKFSIPFQTPQDQAKAEPLLRQFILWPMKPNDIVMSVWLADLSIGMMLDEINKSGSYRMKGYDDLPDYIKDQAVKIDMSNLTVVE